MHVATVLHKVQFKKAKFVAKISSISSPIETMWELRRSVRMQHTAARCVRAAWEYWGDATTECCLCKIAWIITVQTYINKTVCGFHHREKMLPMCESTNLECSWRNPEMSPVWTDGGVEKGLKFRFWPHCPFKYVHKQMAFPSEVKAGWFCPGYQPPAVPVWRRFYQLFMIMCFPFLCTDRSDRFFLPPRRNEKLVPVSELSPGGLFFWSGDHVEMKNNQQSP